MEYKEVLIAQEQREREMHVLNREYNGRQHSRIILFERPFGNTECCHTMTSQWMSLHSARTAHMHLFTITGASHCF